MATTTSRLSLRKPDTTDTVNVETDINDNMDIIDQEIGAQVATSFPVSPYTGKILMRSDQNGRLWIYNGSNWVEVLTRENIMATQQQFNVDDVTTTSTTYTSLSPEVGITFVAPPSGKVLITITAALECTAPSSAYMSYEVRETNSSGNVVHSATDDVKAVGQQESNWHQGSTMTLSGGYTPGQTYYARVMCRSTNSSATATFFYRGIIVQPVEA